MCAYVWLPCMPLIMDGDHTYRYRANAEQEFDHNKKTHTRTHTHRRSIDDKYSHQQP